MTRDFRPKNSQSRKKGKTSKSTEVHTHSPNRAGVPSQLTTFSITLRRGQGIDLGKNSPDSRFVNYLTSVSSRYAISVEKSGKEAHFQGLIVTNLSVDELTKNIRYIYFSWTDAQKRHALHIVPHNDINILYEYVCKQFYVQLPGYDEIYNPIWSTFGHRNNLDQCPVPMLTYHPKIYNHPCLCSIHPDSPVYSNCESLVHREKLSRIEFYDYLRSQKITSPQATLVPLPGICGA